MLPEEAYFSVQETLTSPTPDWTKRSNYSSAPPNLCLQKKGSAFFGSTWPHCVLYFSKNQRSQPLYRRIRQRRRSASSRKQKNWDRGRRTLKPIPCRLFRKQSQTRIRGQILSHTRRVRQSVYNSLWRLEPVATRKRLHRARCCR